MNFLDAEFVQEFIRMANDGWEQGWHERNGGNLSYRVKPEEVELIKENFKAKEWQPIGTSVPNLAGEFFLVTGSGKYFRNVIIKPEDSICMIELDEKGENYRIVWGLVNGGQTDFRASESFDESRSKKTSKSKLPRGLSCTYHQYYRTHICTSTRR